MTQSFLGVGLSLSGIEDPETGAEMISTLRGLYPNLTKECKGKNAIQMTNDRPEHIIQYK